MMPQTASASSVDYSGGSQAKENMASPKVVAVCLVCNKSLGPLEQIPTFYHRPNVLFSRTPATSTLLRHKLESIVKDIVVFRPETCCLCVKCAGLINLADALEAELESVRKQLAEHYWSSARLRGHAEEKPVVTIRPLGPPPAPQTREGRAPAGTPSAAATATATSQTGPVQRPVSDSSDDGTGVCQLLSAVEVELTEVKQEPTEPEETEEHLMRDPVDIEVDPWKQLGYENSDTRERLISEVSRRGPETARVATVTSSRPALRLIPEASLASSRLVAPTSAAPAGVSAPKGRLLAASTLPPRSPNLFGALGGTKPSVPLSGPRPLMSDRGARPPPGMLHVQNSVNQQLKPATSASIDLRPPQPMSQFTHNFKIRLPSSRPLPETPSPSPSSLAGAPRPIAPRPANALPEVSETGRTTAWFHPSQRLKPGNYTYVQSGDSLSGKLIPLPPRVGRPCRSENPVIRLVPGTRHNMARFPPLEKALAIIGTRCLARSQSQKAALRSIEPRRGDERAANAATSDQSPTEIDYKHGEDDEARSKTKRLRSSEDQNWEPAPEPEVVSDDAPSPVEVKKESTSAAPTPRRKPKHPIYRGGRRRRQKMRGRLSKTAAKQNTAVSAQVGEEELKEDDATVGNETEEAVDNVKSEANAHDAEVKNDKADSIEESANAVSCDPSAEGSNSLNLPSGSMEASDSIGATSEAVPCESSERSQTSLAPAKDEHVESQPAPPVRRKRGRPRTRTIDNTIGSRSTPIQQQPSLNLVGRRTRSSKDKAQLMMSTVMADGSADKLDSEVVQNVKPDIDAENSVDQMMAADVAPSEQPVDPAPATGSDDCLVPAPSKPRLEPVEAASDATNMENNPTDSVPAGVDDAETAATDRQAAQHESKNIVQATANTDSAPQSEAADTTSAPAMSAAPSEVDMSVCEPSAPVPEFSSGALDDEQRSLGEPAADSPECQLDPLDTTSPQTASVAPPAVDADELVMPVVADFLGEADDDIPALTGDAEAAVMDFLASGDGED